jgi:hypothetical protein
LTYAITKKLKHISRINIYDNHKIVINSPEVHLGIKRQHAEVGNKNLIIFSYKNNLEKDLQHKFVQFLVQELGKTQRTTYPKFSYRGLVYFDI